MGRDGREATILNRAAKEGLTETVTSEERPEGGKRVSHTDNWAKSCPGTGNGKCKGPEVRWAFNWLTLAVGCRKGFQGRKVIVVVWTGTCSSQHPLPCLVHNRPSINTCKMKEDTEVGLTHLPGRILASVTGSLTAAHGGVSTHPPLTTTISFLHASCGSFCIPPAPLLCLWPLFPLVKFLFPPLVGFGNPQRETSIWVFPAGPE